jgi:hypothetical protein
VTVPAERQPRSVIQTAESPGGPLADRLVALAVLAAAVAAVVLLAAVQPDARGLGTHEQLGMAPCSWPAAAGMPCPTCGVTTAACHVVHLQPLAALRVQPFGAVLAVFGLWLAARALWSLLTATSYLDRLVRVRYVRFLVVSVLLLLASWGYKILTFAP